MADECDVTSVVVDKWLSDAIYETRMKAQRTKGIYDDALIRFNNLDFSSTEEKERRLEELVRLLNIPKVCECGEEIPEARRKILKINCVDCQAERERRF